MDDENPHYVATKYSQRIYWKNGHACGKDDEPDHIELRPPPCQLAHTGLRHAPPVARAL